MRKRKQGGREVYHPRSKPQGTEWTDQQQNVRSSHAGATSGTLMKDRTIATYEREPGPKSLRSNRILQDKYVQRWLEQTTQEANVLSHARHASGGENVSQLIGSSDLSRGFEFVPFARAREHDLNSRYAKAQGRSRKRRRDSSSEDSFLEPALASYPRPEILLSHDMVERVERKKKLESSYRSPRCERLVSIEGSVAPLSINTQGDSFDKRKRHKTKLDRYEPKKALVNPKSQINKGEQKAKRRISKPRRQSRGITADHVMHQFSSDRVGLDRLTMRPSLTAGLFKNGRASSPVMRRGLPDLAFSEMDFLRRSKQHSAEREHKISVPKSREKERRRSERAQNEISQYFQPCTESCIEVEKTRTQKSSHVSNLDCNFHQGGTEDSNNQSSSSESTTPFLDQDRRHPLKQLVQPGAVSYENSILSNGEQTCYTWSGSRKSPRLSQRGQEAYSVVSATPESVQRMMDDTGIFRDIGIDRSTDRTNDTACNGCAISNHLKKNSKLSNIRNFESPSICACKGSGENTQNQPQAEEREDVPRDQSSPYALITRSLTGEGNMTTNEYNLCTTKSIAQNSSLRVGPEEQSGRQENVLDSHLLQAEDSQQSLSRNEIAQKAYFINPTTISATSHNAGSLERSPTSGEAPEKEISTSHLKSAKQVVFGEISVDTHQNLDDGTNKPIESYCSSRADETNAPGDSATSQDIHPQQVEELPSKTPLADQQNKPMQLTDGQRSPRRASDVITDIPITFSNADDINPLKSSDTREETREPQHRLVFEGLPVRGSWPGQVIRPASSHLNINILGETGFLYSRQVRNDMTYGLRDQSHDYRILQRQQFHPYETPLHMRIDDNYAQGTLNGEQRMFDLAANPQDNHKILSNDAESLAYESLQEEPSSCADHDVSQSIANRNDELRDCQYTEGFSRQQCLPIPESNFGWERNCLRPAYESVQRPAQAEDLWESHELRRFWQPRRQY